MSLVSYSKRLDKFITPLFPKVKIKNTIGEVVSKTGLKQLRLSETEKYAHVTYFFNCGNEQKFKGEDRILIQSPKIKTYDLQPEMAIEKVTLSLINALETSKYDFVVVNFANPDMVGHTGDFNAAVKACETVDACAGDVLQAALNSGYTSIVIADHGNSDIMINPDGSPNTAHTTNLVPCILVDNNLKPALKEGKLGDLAPTILKLMGIDIPAEIR